MKAGIDERYTNEAYKNLATAIIEEACDDYLSAMRKVKNELTIQRKSDDRDTLMASKHRLNYYQGQMADCEGFFRSEWFQLLCDGKISGRTAINTLRRRARFTNAG